MNTDIEHNAQNLTVVREEVLHDEFENEEVLNKIIREHNIPSFSGNVDLDKPPVPEIVFSKTEEEFRKLGFKVERVDTEHNQSCDRAQISVSSVNRKTKELRASKLIVVLVEGTFVSITSFP